MTTDQIERVVRGVEWSGADVYEDWDGDTCARPCCLICRGVKPGLPEYQYYGLRKYGLKEEKINNVGHQPGCVYLEIAG